MTPKLFVVPPPLNAAIMLAPVLVALWRGGWREQLIAATAAAGYLFNLAFPLALRLDMHAMRGFRALSEDAVLLAVCLVCVVRARRYGVIMASAFALLSVVTDILYLSLPDISPMVMIYAGDIWAYALSATLLWTSLSSSRAREAAA